MQERIRSTEQMSLDWDGVSVYAERSAPTDSSASDKTIILLHGLGGSHQYWSKILTNLTSYGYHAIALDLPGHGQSELPTNQSLTPKWMGQALANWLKTQSDQKYIIVGHSLGGWVALQAYLHDATAINSLVLIASAGLEGVNFAPPKMDMSGGFSGMMEQLFGTLFYDPSKLEQTELQNILNQAMSAPALMNLSPEGMLKPTDLQAIDCPSLVIWGENDQLIPSKWAQTFQENLSSSELKLLPECGHIPQLEKPSEVSEYLRQFLQ